MNGVEKGKSSRGKGGSFDPPLVAEKKLYIPTLRFKFPQNRTINGELEFFEGRTEGLRSVIFFGVS